MKLLRQGSADISPFIWRVNGRSLFGHIIYLGGMKTEHTGNESVTNILKHQKRLWRHTPICQAALTFISPCCCGKDCIPQCKRSKWSSWQICCLSAKKEFLLKTLYVTFWFGTMSSGVQESKAVMIILFQS